MVSRDAWGVVLIHGGIMTPLKSYTKKPTMDWWEALAFFQDNDVAEVTLENVHSMPGQGIASSFQFGRVFGCAEMLAANMFGEPQYVTPQVWKKHFGLSADKYASMEKATELFGTDKYWKLKKHEGVAEAALIALYGLGKTQKDT